MAANVTALLKAWSAGENAALDQLAPAVQAELRRIAARYMKNERPGHTLQPTALVNEAYLRLIDSERVQLQDRAHFFAVAARMMRRILVDAARARTSNKRGGTGPRISLDEGLVPAVQRDREMVALD